MASKVVEKMRPKAFAMKFRENAWEEWLEKCFLWLPAGTFGRQLGDSPFHVGGNGKGKGN